MRHHRSWQGVDHISAWFFHGYFKCIQAMQLCIRSRFKKRISFWISSWISKTLWMVGICDISSLYNNASYSDYNTSVEEQLPERPGLLFNCQRQLKIQIYKFLHQKLHELSQNVQPQAKSDGNPLIRSPITQGHEHSPHQATVALLSVQQLTTPFECSMQDLPKVALYTPSHIENTFTI